MSNSTAAPRKNQVLAAVIGNALEWYDFIVFGFLAVVISRLFFPAESEYSALLMATATFGVGFFMRPIGGVLLGIYADRKGRKAALQLIISLMTLSIAMIAFAPPFAAIGIAAPLLIVLARLMQGFATGGEFASATSFLIESAPANRRGLYGSWQMFGQGLAVFCGAGVTALVTSNLSPADLDSWGWRIPFIIGLIIGPVGLWMRRNLSETEAFLEARQAPKEKQSLARMLRSHLRQVVTVMALTVCGTVAFYVILVYMPTFANRQLGMQLKDAFTAQVVAVAVLTLLMPVFGALSDRVGRKLLMIVATLGLLVALYPLFSWIHAAPSFGRLLTMQLILCSLLAVFFGPFSAAVAEQFPAGVRSTGLALAYNLAVMIFGGFAQFIVTWLIQNTGMAIAPVFYVLFAVTLGLIGSFFLIDRTHEAHLAVVDESSPLKAAAQPTGTLNRVVAQGV
ncbi:MAG: MFS transporter [Gammaproteobacteria bacterium HGW-Gammaproteobacteria-9]|jgi:MFS family permease|uniref:MFS transporter n=1 Tax=Pseudomonas sp. (strain SCT) TaxID=412955 RepID=UPI000CB61F69|nr:MFS transporter [Pseudomonas sp. SCT]PKL99767.1 MAG: MFS transporter [Gammaproteobacteria bacterium HGW-Gammaproteobacteria-9]GCA55263.1 proline/betaine transporter [Pseudomonas sp. SCT]